MLAVRLRFVRRSLVGVAALAAGFLGASRADAAGSCGRTRFVTIYDSHGLTPYGDRLDAALLDRGGAALASYTLGGASPSWLVRRPISPRGYVFEGCDKSELLPRSRLLPQDVRTPSLPTLLQVPGGAYDRQVVVLTLGSNVPGEPSVQTRAVEAVVRAVRAAPGATCVWVGPPAIRKWSEGYSNQVYAAIKDGIRAASTGREPACHLIDSRLFTSYPAGGDGMHFGFTASHVEAAHRWAEGVAGAIDLILRVGVAPVELAEARD